MVLDAAPSEERLARMLKISQRTLRRRLEAEGTSVKALVAEVRGEIACQLLAETSMPVKEIASALNYAGPGIFSRAFKSWTGRTPRAFRTAALRKLGERADGYQPSSKT
jgi:AraC-like DNA-binding protein